MQSRQSKLFNIKCMQLEAPATHLRRRPEVVAPHLEQVADLGEQLRVHRKAAVHSITYAVVVNLALSKREM